MEAGKIAFIGTGIIGAGLAVNALVAGNECILYDVASELQEGAPCPDRILVGHS